MKKILLLMALTLPFVLISCGDDKDEPENPDTRKWVDLGLPSGMLWATCNIGADSPEDYGDYFAWGETSPKEVYNWDTYKWGEATEYIDIWKYIYDYYDYSSGTTTPGDGKTELDSSDDAATANWGAEARMPSLEEIQELMDNCSWEWVQRNGVYGQQGTGPNGNTIFLPAAGYRSDESLRGEGSNGYFWSRTLSPHDCASACNLNFDMWDLCWQGFYNRINGFPVRAVRVTQN